MPSVPEPAAGGPPPPLPESRPRYLWFDGIVEGPRVDDGTLRGIVAEWNRLGLGEAGLELDGGRFSILVSDRTLHAGNARLDSRRELEPLLRRLRDAVAPQGELESTLRATEVHEEVVVETLFTVAGGRLRAVSRARPLREADRHRAPVPARTGGVWRVAGIAVVVLAATGVLAWYGGVIDGLFAPPAAALDREIGPFEGLLAWRAEGTMDGYRVVVERGRRYPLTVAEREALEAAATRGIDRAAIRAVADGRRIWVRLEDAGGEVLVARPLELAGLLEEPPGTVAVDLPGHLAAERLEMGLARR